MQKQNISSRFRRRGRYEISRDPAGADVRGADARRRLGDQPLGCRGEASVLVDGEGGTDAALDQPTHPGSYHLAPQAHFNSSQQTARIAGIIANNACREAALFIISLRKGVRRRRAGAVLTAGRLDQGQERRSVERPYGGGT